jgi:phage/plasmid-like protein (TIGR03299 family)
MSFFTKIETRRIKLAMERAGHDFTVKKVPLYIRKNMRENIEGGDILDHVAIVNSETGQYLGTVGKGWEPVQPKILYELAKELIDATGAIINGAINMFGGSVIGLSFRLATKEYIENDPTELNFIMLTAFNGRHGISGHAVTNRIVCMNQCNTSNNVYNLKHTKFVGGRINVAKRMMRYYNDEIRTFDDKMKKLIHKRMNIEETETWFRSLFPFPKSPKAEKNLDEQVLIFLQCLNDGQGSNLQGVRGTYYGAFQALTEYINHYRRINIHKIEGQKREADEVRFQSIHFGTNNDLAQKGLTKLTQDMKFEFSENDFLLD